MTSPYNKPRILSFNDKNDLKDTLNNLADNCFNSNNCLEYSIKIETIKPLTKDQKNEIKVTYEKQRKLSNKTPDEHFKDYMKDRGLDFYAI